MKLKNKIVALFLTVACAFGLAVAGNAQRVDAAGTYNLASEIADGDEILFVCKSKNVAGGALSTTSTKYILSVNVTVAGNSITIGSEKVQPFTVVAHASNAGQYAFKNADGKYLAWSSGNSAALNDSAYYWKVSFSGDNATVESAATAGRKFQYNASSPRFASYTSTQTAIQIFKAGAAAVLSDAEKAQQAVDALTAPTELKYNTNLKLTGLHESTVTWVSDNDAISVNNETGLASVGNVASDVTVKLTATATVGSASSSKEFTVTVKALTEKEPVVGTEYKMMLTQKALNADLYLLGTNSGNYLATTKTYAEGAVVVLEKAPYDGYYISVIANGGTKQYINLVTGGSNGNLNIGATASTAWAYNDQYDTFTTVSHVSGLTVYIGTYNEFNTFSASAMSYITSSTNYVSHLVENLATPEEQISELETMVQFGVNFTETVTEKESDGVATNTIISFATTDERTLQNGDVQIWEKDGVVFTNNQGSSTSAVVDSSNPVRLYASSNIVIEATSNISKIVFTSDTAEKYVTALTNSVEGTGTVSANSNVITVELDGTSNVYTIEKLTAQCRLKSVEVFTAGAGVVTETTYSGFNSAKLRFVGVIPASLVEYVDLAAGAGVVLTLADGRTQEVEVQEQGIVEEADGSLRFAVVLNVPADQYDTEVTGQAFVYLNGASSRTLLQEKTFSVNSIVDHYIANASDLGLGAAEIAVLNAFKAA